MSSNRAFIDAFRSTVGRVDAPLSGATRPQGLDSPPVWTTTYSTAENLDAGTSSVAELTATGQAVAPRPQRGAETEEIFHFGPRVPHRPRQTLASLLAGESSRSAGTHQAPGQNDSGSPRWPTICQQLLADVSCEYDTLLRATVATSSTGMLLGVTGVTPQSGCTTTAICLALRAAALGKSTLLVDADWDRPNLASILELQPSEPWPSLIRQGRPVTEGFLSRGDAGVDLLLNAKGNVLDVDATNTLRLTLAAGAMRRKYQCVIFDLGCVADEHPGGRIATALGIDQVLLVANPTSTDREVELACSSIERRRMALHGILQAA